MNLDERYSVCPKCGQVLDIQEGFNENNKVHVCTNCGEALFNPLYDDKLKYKDVLWICDKCGDYLNNQDGFTDWNDVWKCKKCGFLNDVTSENIDKMA